MKSSLIPWGSDLPQPMNSLRREMDSLFDRFFNGQDETSMLGSFSPRVNVAESDEAYDVTVELPGLSSKDFSVEVKENQLWISGEKKEETEARGKTYHRVERRYGAFREVIPFAQSVDADRINAEYKNGVLTVRVAKHEAAKPRRIAVKS
jgi:HSP20 family protein